MKQKQKQNGIRYIQIIIGVLFLAVAYKCIYDSVGMVTGGFSGIGVIVRHVTQPFFPGGIPMWVTNIILNTPLYVVAYNIEGKAFIKRCFLGTVLLTVALAVLPGLNFADVDYLLVAVYGGVLCGIGEGLILKSGLTTGGTDMLAVVIRKKLPQYSVAQILQCVDGLVVLCGIAVFGFHVSLYAIIAIYVAMLVTNGVSEGFKRARAALIISDHSDSIAKAIMEQIDRGVTIIPANGAFSGENKNILLCVVSRKQLPALRQLVVEMDRKSFFIVGDVNEVLGEGFVQNLQ